MREREGKGENQTVIRRGIEGKKEKIRVRERER